LSSPLDSLTRPRRSARGFGNVHYAATLVFFLFLSFLVGFLICSSAGILAAAPGWDLWVMLLPALLLYWAVPVPIVAPVGGTLHLYVTAGATVLVVLAFLWALLSPRDGFLRPLLSGERRMWRLGALESVGMGYMAAVSLNVVWIYVLKGAGIDPQTPAGLPLWSKEQVAEALFFASVWEEASVKLTLISLPLIVAHFSTAKMLPWRRYLLGGHIPIDRLAGLLMMVSAAVFGYLHVIGGWDWTKFPPAFAFGMVTGYLFLRFGLYASILLHFANNFLLGPVLLASRPSVNTAIALVFLFFVLVGLVYWFLLARTIVRTVAATRRGMAAGEGGAAAGSPTWSQGEIHPLTMPEARGVESSGTTGRGPAPQGAIFPTWPRPLPPRPPRPHDPYACALCGSREYRFLRGELECIGCGAAHGRPEGDSASGEGGEEAPKLKDIMKI
jgi:hypothetical protein